MNPSTPTAIFIDTNVLLYAASDGRQDPEKKRLAEELIATRPFVVSMQVVQEFHVKATQTVDPGGSDAPPQAEMSAKTSEIALPARASITRCVSRNVKRRISAANLPTLDLSAPMKPKSARFRIARSLVIPQKHPKAEALARSFSERHET